MVSDTIGPESLTLQAEVAKWQTRYIQGVVFVRTCEFESRLRHQKRNKLGPPNRREALRFYPEDEVCRHFADTGFRSASRVHYFTIARWRDGVQFPNNAKAVLAMLHGLEQKKSIPLKKRYATPRKAHGTGSPPGGVA